MSEADLLVVDRSGCRACGASLEPLLDLGRLTLSTFLLPHEPDPPTAPLDLVLCRRCTLVQLRHMVDQQRLFGTTYWYRSGINETMRAELKDVASAATIMVDGLTSRDVVLDVGANDGTGLASYEGLSNPPFRIGVEPAAALIPRLAEVADAVRHGFFPQATWGLADHSVKILTSIAMFYDVNDPLGFVAEVDRLLRRDGVWIVQMQDLAQMVEATAFDNVCFEHACYYSIRTFEALLSGFDLRLVKIEQRAINGGSLRFYIRRRAMRADQANLDEFLRWEAWLTYDALQHFAWRVGQHQERLRDTLDYLIARGHPIDLYAASTKSSTLLQSSGIDHRRIRQAVERTPEKVGRVTSGTRIPIVSEADWRQDPAPHTLVGAWQFRASILQREADYLARGGRFLFPLPAVEVVSSAESGLHV